MSFLFIGEKEVEAIADAIAKAKAKPTPLEILMQIAKDDRADPTDTLLHEQRGDPALIAKIHAEYPSIPVQLGSYTAAISFEHQPGGLLRHISMASREPGKVPNEHAAKMILEAFGFSGYPLARPHRIWVEEYEPGRYAVNVAELEPS